jgi:hypothetical protein
MQGRAIAAALLVLAAAMMGALLANYYLSMLSPGGTATTSGTLAIMLTDPPRVPLGVSAIYLSYNTIGVHFAEAGNQSGWVSASVRGTANLMQLVNISTTIASLNITGKLNLLRFNVSSVKVTYNGVNYTCYVPSNELTVPIVGGVEVRAGAVSAVILDLEPMVLNMGSAENPIFVLRPSAKAMPVPAEETSREMARQGFTVDLKAKAWWARMSERLAKRIEITSAQLTNSSLRVTLRNVGNESVALRLLVIWPAAGPMMSSRAMAPPAFFHSAVFVIEENGTLVPLQFGCGPVVSNRTQLEKCLIFGGAQGKLADLLQGSGYVLGANSTAALSYEGFITLGYGIQGCRLVEVERGHWQLVCDFRANSVQAGAEYLIAVIGDGALATYLATAS